MPSKLQLQLGTHSRRCVTSVESWMRTVASGRPLAAFWSFWLFFFLHFWASTPISFSFRCPWDFSTSTVRRHFCWWAAEKHESTHRVKGHCRWRPPWAKTAKWKKKTTSTDDNFGNQMCKFSEMIDVGIFGSYLIDSERKFMGFGSSNPHIDLGFTQFVTVWYICLIQIQTCWEMRHDQIEEAHLGVDASRSCGEDFLTRHLNRFAMVCTCMNHMLTPQAPTCFTSTPINLTWDPGTNDP